MPFSYSAPSYSKKDEERDYADLTPEQKEAILDDAFGRTAEEIALHNQREITKQEFDAFDEALENLPGDVNAEAAIAAKTVLCPELVECESNPSMFLRYENYNPQKAAKRFASYWNFRVDLFGNEKAFLPMTTSEGGALHEDEELLRMIREVPSYRYILPNDSHGRSVVYLENNQQKATTMFSRDTKYKYHFYTFQKLMSKPSSISKGLVVLGVLPDKGQLNLGGFDRIFFKKITMYQRNSFPVKVRAIHITTAQTSLAMELILPAVRVFQDPEGRLRFFLHSNKNKFVEELEQYGFKKEDIPDCVGGTYHFTNSVPS